MFIYVCIATINTIFYITSKIVKKSPPREMYAFFNRYVFETQDITNQKVFQRRMFFALIQYKNPVINIDIMTEDILTHISHIF